MDKFKVDVISATANPQQVIWAAMHQDYSEDFVAERRDKFPDEEKAGELIVKHLLAGNRGHFGCTEHPQIVFNVGFFPHSMMQQLRTHRVGVSFDVQCLAGDTEITFINASKSLRKIKISELYDLWVNGEKATRERKIRGRKDEPPGQYRRNCQARLRKMKLRVLNEGTGIFEYGQIKDVMCSGLQPVYRLTLEDGKTLDCTTNHRLFTSEGWQTMGDAVGLLTFEDGSVLQITKTCFVMCNGKAVAGNGFYRDKIWLQNQIIKGLSTEEIAYLSKCSTTTVRDWAKRYGLFLNDKNTKFHAGQKPWNYNPTALYRKKDWLFAISYQPILEPKNWQSKQRSPGNKLHAHPLKIVSVEYLGEQMTYDLEVEGSWHNFVANGIVVHNSFRYTGSRIIDVVVGKRDIEEVFYLRPVDYYTNRQGKKYYYSEAQRQEDLQWCLDACKLYKKRIEEGLAEEHARSIIPFDARQHFVMSCNLRSLMHILDLRWKKDAQLEVQKLCELLYQHFQQWTPAVAKWYLENRAQKARLSP